MNINKIYNFFFYLNTGAKSSGKETTIISSFGAFVIIAISAILKQVFFSSLVVGINFVFVCFLIIGLMLNYFNQKKYKRRNSEFTRQWLKESKTNKIVFKVFNIIFMIFTFFILIYILSYFS
ncbi:hypothetical protein [Flavobacterium geliluteum]|uniref:Uncharacterized protein n=1 Tax=Flavobacterium geliluteum TaxID=2816120 RepID=A0A940XA96_9FLAO|nr:hypothetical protein [Flavobacterium geliluteum]MBP4138632.1 hypothetical protein [Flavobacterium geliluteum]